MRTWETVLGSLTLALALGLAFAPSAFAQNETAEDPTLNESEMDTTPPPSDESYLDEAEQESTTADPDAEPTLSESDMDTTPPASDESYLDEAEAEIGAADGADDGAASGSGSDTGSGSEGGDDAASTPGAPLVALVAGVGLLALALRRR